MQDIDFNPLVAGRLFIKELKRDLFDDPIWILEGSGRLDACARIQTRKLRDEGRDINRRSPT